MIRKIIPFLFCLLCMFSGILPAVSEEPKQQEEVPSLNTVIKKLKERTANLSYLGARPTVERGSNQQDQDQVLSFLSMTNRFEVQNDRYFRTITRFNGDEYYFSRLEQVTTKKNLFSLISIAQREGSAFFSVTGVPYSKQFQGFHAIRSRGWLSFQGSYTSQIFRILLFPQYLNRHKSEWTIRQVEEEETPLLRLQRSHKLFMPNNHLGGSITLRLFLKPDTFRLHHFSFLTRGNQRASFYSQFSFDVHVSERKTMAEMSLPVKLDVTFRSERNDFSITLQDLEYETGKQSGQERTRPDWVEDPSLPVQTDQSLEEIKQAADGESASAETYLRYVNKFVSEHGKYDPDKLPINKLLPYAKKAVQNERSSHIANQYYVTYLYANEEWKKIIEHYHTLKKHEVQVPQVRFLAALSHMKLNHPKRTKELLRTFSEDSPFGNEIEKLEFELTFQSKTKPGELLTFLNDLFAEKSLEEVDSLLAKVEPEHPHSARKKQTLSDRSVPVLDQMASRAETDVVKLVLARAFANKEKYAKANKLYKRLPRNEFMNKEITRYVQRVEEKASSLMGRVADDINDPELKLAYVQHLFEKGDSRQATKLVETFTRKLKKSNEDELDGDRTRNFHSINSEVLHSILRTLQKQEKKELAKRFLKEMVQSNSQILMQDELSETVKELYGSKPKELYPLVRYVRPDYIEYYYIDPITDALRIAHRRVQEDQFDKQDLIFLSRSIQKFDKLDLDSKLNDLSLRSSLEIGMKKFPDNQQIKHRWADLLFLQGGFSESFKTYRNMLAIRTTELKKKSPSSNRNVPFDTDNTRLDWHIDSLEERKNWMKSFSPSEPLVMKLARAWKRTDGSDDIIGEVQNYFDLLPSPSISLITMTFELLGRPEEGKSFATKYIRNVFRDKNSSHNVFQKAKAFILFLLCNEDYVEAHVLTRLFITTFDREKDKFQKYLKSTRKKFDQKELINYDFSGQIEPPSKKKKRRVLKQINRLGASSLSTREKAIQSLKQIGLPAVPLLKKRLQDPNPEVRTNVRDILQFISRKQIQSKYFSDLLDTGTSQ